MKLSYRVGITTKLLLVVTSIIVMAIGAVVYIASDLYLEESINRIQVNNKDSVLHSSLKLKNSFEDLASRMKLMAQVVDDNGYQSPQAKSTVNRVLSGFDNFLSFYIYHVDANGGADLQFSSLLETALSEFEIDEKQLELLPLKEVLKVVEKKEKDFYVINSSKTLNRPILSVAFYTKSEKGEKWLFRADIRQSILLASLPENNEITSYVVNASGEVIAHSDKYYNSQIFKGLNYKNQPVVRDLLASQLTNQQMEYYTQENEAVLGAYRKVGVADLSIVAQVPKAKALATIQQVQYRSFLVMVIVICLAFFINFAFSHSLTEPLSRLYYATSRIVEGNFDVRLRKTSSDELGALTLAFNDMASGLKEREKIKTAFNKFHSKEVAQKLLSGEIKLGGERKLATILFSDIRGFTNMSEKMSPDEVVQLLNEYLTGMVHIITKWNGVVDKYIGDAIMAVWGVPETKPDDAYNAVRCALEMRDYMIKFNQGRQSPLRIGIGIHSGEVLAGNIGSEERLEYTCIGDNVNQTSRIESATKAMDTDILISDATKVLVESKGIVVGPEVPVQVKGKTQALKVQQVIGYKENGKLLTCLDEEQIQKIQVTTQIAEMNDSKVISENTFIGATHVGPIDQNTSMPEMYFLVSDPLMGNKEGPFTADQVRAKMAQGDFDPRQALICRINETNLHPVIGYFGVDRRINPVKSRATPPPLNEEVRLSSFSNEWYIYGPKGEHLGPYTLEDLQAALEAGHVTRTTFVWQTGLENWIPLHQIEGFNRRSA